MLHAPQNPWHVESLLLVQLKGGCNCTCGKGLLAELARDDLVSTHSTLLGQSQGVTPVSTVAKNAEPLH